MGMHEHARHDAVINLGGMGKVDGNEVGRAGLNAAAQRGVADVRAADDVQRIARVRMQQADQLGLCDLCFLHTSREQSVSVREAERGQHAHGHARRGRRRTQTLE
jgi:hypothetical protein